MYDLKRIIITYCAGLRSCVVFWNTSTQCAVLLLVCSDTFRLITPLPVASLLSALSTAYYYGSTFLLYCSDVNMVTCNILLLPWKSNHTEAPQDIYLTNHINMINVQWQDDYWFEPMLTSQKRKFLTKDPRSLDHSIGAQYVSGYRECCSYYEPLGGGLLGSASTGLGLLPEDPVSRLLSATSRLLLLSIKACRAASLLKPISMMSLRARSSTCAENTGMERTKRKRIDFSNNI